MKVCFDDNFNPEQGRTHPYEPSDWAVYYDLKKNPELIPNVLEDFKPWSHYQAVQVFYQLLAWLNGPNSTLESNDCAFRGPEVNDDPRFPKALGCTGRLMIFYRRLELNTMDEWVDALKKALRHYLSQIDPEFGWGVVTISTAPVLYKELSTNMTKNEGSETLLTFFAWGDDEGETMENLERVFKALLESFKLISTEIKRATA